MSKAISFRLDDEVVEKLNYYSTVTGKSKTKFIEDALEKEFINTQMQRSGAIRLNIPNVPVAMTEKQKKEVVSKFKDSIKDLPIDLGLVATWLEQRLLLDSEDFKRKLMENFYQDIQFENNLKEESFKAENK